MSAWNYCSTPSSLLCWPSTAVFTSYFINSSAELRSNQQVVLEPAVGNRQQRCDCLLVRLAAQIGDAIFGDHQVLQVSWNGCMRVIRRTPSGGRVLIYSRAAACTIPARSFTTRSSICALVMVSGGDMTHML